MPACDTIEAQHHGHLQRPAPPPPPPQVELRWRPKQHRSPKKCGLHLFSPTSTSPDAWWYLVGSFLAQPSLRCAVGGCARGSDSHHRQGPQLMRNPKSPVCSSTLGPVSAVCIRPVSWAHRRGTRPRRVDGQAGLHAHRPLSWARVTGEGLAISPLLLLSNT